MVCVTNISTLGGLPSILSISIIFIVCVCDELMLRTMNPLLKDLDNMLHQMMQD